jgi:hypothetical protein
MFRSLKRVIKLKGYGVTCGGSLLFMPELLDFIEESVGYLIKLMIS